jgi:DMSO/TMAO reductase YedYZ molybdopterin-dependent catalytic subunit
MFGKKDPAVAARIPPGQHLTRGWPVLTASPVPPFDPDTWRFRCTGLCDGIEWTWEEFRALPAVTLTSDFHCVTGWSKLDNTWEGVLFKDVAELASVHLGATHAVIKAPYGYDANLPLDALLDDDVLFAWSHNGEPLEPKHGGPLRLIVPKRYAWKSVKFANEVELLDHDQRGFWEVRGYHNDAFPFEEQRYAWQENT